jgi:hypothetical protein
MFGRANINGPGVLASTIIPGRDPFWFLHFEEATGIVSSTL